MQQLPAELAFQRAQGLTDPRLGQAKPLGAASKVQLLGQDQEDPEFTKFDDIRKRLGIDTHLHALQRSLEGASVVNDLTIYTLARARPDEIHAEAAPRPAREPAPPASRSSLPSMQ